MVHVSSYCKACRAVVAPETIKAQVLGDELDIETGFQAGRARMIRAEKRAGQDGASIQPWSLVLADLSLGQVRRSQLFNEWVQLTDDDPAKPGCRRRNPLATPKMIGDVRARMLQSVGIYHGAAARDVDTPCPGATVITLDTGAVAHILDDMTMNRLDKDHAHYWPLTIPTLMSPIEVWADDGGDILFFGAYRVGLSIDTHVVIVNGAARRVVTSYRLAEAELRTDGKRKGTPLYAAWI